MADGQYVDWWPPPHILFSPGKEEEPSRIILPETVTAKTHSNVLMFRHKRMVCTEPPVGPPNGVETITPEAESTKVAD